MSASVAYLLLFIIETRVPEVLGKRAKRIGAVERKPGQIAEVVRKESIVVRKG